MADVTTAPPRDNLIRMLSQAPELRAAEQGMPTMVGHFVPFNQWTAIHSSWEGDFMERFAPGSLSKTFQENRVNMRSLFQHGQDPSIGEKVLGPITELREDDYGAYYEVPLLDTSYNRDLLPGLEQNLYGTSFRFGVMKEQMNRKAKPSEFNPDGLPERTVLEARISEFGPVTFPAYAGGSAGIRSGTDDYILRRLGSDPDRLRDLLQQHVALPVAGAESSHSEAKEAASAVANPRFKTREDFLTWISKT